jgi:hypothetical protein
MKNLVYLTAIAITGITGSTSPSVTAQGVFNGNLPPGYSSTTIYSPSTGLTTTTTKIVTPYSPSQPATIVNPVPIPNNNYYYYGNGVDIQRGITDRPPTIIIQPSNVYAPALPSRCTTAVIGNPIASPVPLDRFTGKPCV